MSEGPVKGSPSQVHVAVGRSRPLILLFALLVVIALAYFEPHALLTAGDRIGYAVCHQIPERSFYAAGRPLPLCARCTGTFLGALLGFAMIAARRRTRATQVPGTAVLATLALFFGLWAFDGINSYLTLFPGAPHLYEPHNMLRMTTGALNGLMLSSLILPVVALTTWAEGSKERSIASVAELGVLVLLAGGLIGLAALGWEPVLYLFGLFSVAGVLALLLAVNLIIAVVALRRENRARRWRDLALPALLAILATALEISALNAFRWYLMGTLGAAI